jgi:hypothetical protein
LTCRRMGVAARGPHRLLMGGSTQGALLSCTGPGRAGTGSGDLVGDIVYRSELWTEERQLVEHEGWKEHESRVLDLGLLLNCFERR